MTSVAKFSLCVLLSSAVVQATPPAGTEDRADTTCTVGLQCKQALAALPNPVRGLCTSSVVGAVTGESCWDACNTDHAPIDYSSSATVAEREGIALMVKQFRTGMRGADSCAGALLVPTCNPGERCTPPQATWGRGMCVLGLAGQGNQCLDMCDTSIDMALFKDTPGKQAGTVNIVNSVRAGRDPRGLVTCPITGAMLWLLIPLTLFCCVGLVGGAAWVFNYMRTLRRKQNSNKNQNYREPEQQFLEEQQQPYADYGQEQPQEQYQQRDYAEEPMPVMEPIVEAPVVQAQQMNIFGGEPNLMGGLAPLSAPLTVAAPTTMYPSLAAPMTAAYPTASYQLPVQQGYAQAGSSYVTGSQFGGSMALTGGATTTQMPAYGAYGAYGVQAAPQMVSTSLNQTVYPTGSMRIG